MLIHGLKGIPAETEVISITASEQGCPVGAPGTADTVVTEPAERIQEALAAGSAPSFTYRYTMELRNNEPGHWFFGIENQLDACTPAASEGGSAVACRDEPINMLVTFERYYTCEPECEHGGKCSQQQDNMCICSGTGYTGSRCTIGTLLTEAAFVAAHSERAHTERCGTGTGTVF